MLPPGLAAAGKGEPCDEDDLQAAEEVSPRHRGMGVTNLGGEQQFSLPHRSPKEGKFPWLVKVTVASHRRTWRVKLMHKINVC